MYLYLREWLVQVLHLDVLSKCYTSKYVARRALVSGNRPMLSCVVVQETRSCTKSKSLPPTAVDIVLGELNELFLTFTCTRSGDADGYRVCSAAYDFRAYTRCHGPSAYCCWERQPIEFAT